MDEPLDEQYLEWLYRQVASVRLKNPARTYWSLLRQLFSKEFIFLIPNDDNRMEDGRDLRNEFVRECNIPDPDPEWMRMGCSMLEMIIGLARRLEFEADGLESRGWFWELLKNLDLEQYTDLYYKRNSTTSRDLIDETLDRVIWRNYEPDGHGGLFPLNGPCKDQRKVELWYQLAAYLLERV